MRNSLRAGPAWIALQCLWVTFASAAGGTVSPFGDDRPAVLEDFRPHLMSAEGYTEEWTYSVWMEGGSFLSMDWGISNLGWGDRNGYFRITHRDSQGKASKCSASYDDGKWLAAKEGFSLQFGKNQVSGDLQSQVIESDCDKLQLHLRFQNEAPPYVPGSGKLLFGKNDGLYSMVFSAPRARVEGELTLGGVKMPVTGVGHSNHSYYDMSPDKQVRRWFRFKWITNEISFVLAELQSTPMYAQERNGWALVYNADGRIIATTRVVFEFDKYIQEKDISKGYQIPRIVRFSASDGQNHLNGTLRMESIKEVGDPLKDLGTLKRAFIRQFIKPKDYSINCLYEMKLNTAGQVQTFQGKSTFQFFYVNP